MLVKDASELVGSTPLIEVSRFGKAYELKARLLVKAEYFNPAGSVKDRVAKEMIEEILLEQLVQFNLSVTTTAEFSIWKCITAMVVKTMLLSV